MAACQNFTKAVVSWRPYQGGGIGYQYPSESKQVITAQNGGELTYSTQTIKEQTEGIRYKIHYRCKGTVNKETGYPYNSCGEYFEVITHLTFPGKILGIFERPDYPTSGYMGIRAERGGVIYENDLLWIDGGNIASWQDSCNNYYGGGTYSRGLKGSYEFLDAIRADGQQDPIRCKFTVFEDGTEIFSRTELICPTVENIPCQINQEKAANTITISKSSNQLIEVSKYSYLVDSQGYQQQSALAANQLNIYKVTPKTDTDSNNQYQLIKQIESECKDKPPTYKIECSGEDCPNNTCKVECGNHYCCYDGQGNPVKTIPK